MAKRNKIKVRDTRKGVGNYCAKRKVPYNYGAMYRRLIDDHRDQRVRVMSPSGRMVYGTSPLASHLMRTGRYA